MVGKGVCMRVERVGGEEVWFLFDFCNADAQTVISFLKTCGLDKDFKVHSLQNSLVQSFFRRRYVLLAYPNFLVYTPNLISLPSPQQFPNFVLRYNYTLY